MYTPSDMLQHPCTTPLKWYGCVFVILRMFIFRFDRIDVFHLVLRHYTLCKIITTLYKNAKYAISIFIRFYAFAFLSVVRVKSACDSKNTLCCTLWVVSCNIDKSLKLQNNITPARCRHCNLMEAYNNCARALQSRLPRVT